MWFREDTDASMMEGEYEWVREYLYDVRQDEEKRTYILRETPTYMAYVDLNTRLMVHKRGKRMKSDSVMAQEFPRPSQVCSSNVSASLFGPKGFIIACNHTAMPAYAAQC